MATSTPKAAAKDAINAALALFHKRWMLRVIWELREGPFTFRALQERCDGVSPSVLNERLAELRKAGLADTDEGGYRLTPIGAELVVAFAPLTAWALRWQRASRR